MSRPTTLARTYSPELVVESSMMCCVCAESNKAERRTFALGASRHDHASCRPKRTEETCAESSQNFADVLIRTTCMYVRA